VALDTRSFDENAADAAMEKELDDIANRLWKIKTKLRGGKNDAARWDIVRIGRRPARC
jgi:hypothetical protein